MSDTPLSEGDELLRAEHVERIAGRCAHHALWAPDRRIRDEFEADAKFLRDLAAELHPGPER